MTKIAFPLILGTANAKKVVEIRAILKEGGIPVAPWPSQVPMPPVIEDGETFLANAVKKAVSLARALGGDTWVLADDSGLEVDALGGRPGVRSHRYAGEPPDDAKNNRKLLEEMRGDPPGKRTARFRCAVALANGAGRTIAAEGSCEGVVAEAPRGDNDFAYDPVFYYPPLARTFAELAPAEKNRVSHRAAALANLVEKLKMFAF